MALTSNASPETYVPAVVQLPNVFIQDNGTQQLVADGWARSQDYADQAFRAALDFVARLKLSVGTWISPNIDTNLNQLNLDLAAFTAAIGTIPAAPANSFAFTEIPYSSTLLTDLRARLLEWVDGKSTGLLPSVEQAIWDRGRAREVVSSNRKAQEAVRSFSMRGFSKPPGALSIEIQDAVQEAQNTSVTLSRDVMIKQAELEQTNRRFSFEQAEKMEEALISYTNLQMQRALDKAKELQQFAISIYQAQVSMYGVGVSIYTARIAAEASVFKAKTDIQVAEANIRIEAAKVQIQALIQEVTLHLEAMKAGAQVSSQLAASALSSLSISAQLADHVQQTGSVSAGYTSHVADSVSLGANATYNY